MDKPAFDPNKPFTAAAADKPAFDPNKPFTGGAAQTQPAQIMGTGNDSGGPFPSATAIGKTALDAGLRGLNYLSGAARTAAVGATSWMGPNGQVVNQDDLEKALKGQAPGMSEYYDRMGVPEGGKVNVPLVGPISARGALGFASDVALDPLTYVPFLGAGSVAEKAAAAKAGQALLEGGGKAAGEVAAPSIAAKVADTVLNPVKNMTSSAGDNLYKSGFKTIDAKLAAKGEEPLSEVMFNNGRPAGTAATMSQAVQDLIDSKMAQRDAMYDAINSKGGKVDLINAMQPAVEKGKDILRVDPNAGPQIASMGDWLANYGKNGQHVPVDLASDFKSNLYNAQLPPNAYNPFGQAMNAPAQMKQQFARGLKEGIENAAETHLGTGQGAAMGDLNSDVGTLINSQKKALPSEVLKGATKNAVTPIDAALPFVAGHEGGSPNIWALAAKKGADALNTMGGRTYLGNALSGAADTNMIDPIMRRILINQNQPAQPQQSPWMQMQKGNN